MAATPAELVDDRGGKADAVLDRLREYLHDGAAQRGLITKEALSGEMGRTESSTDPAFMRRVALAMVDLNHNVEDQLAPKGIRPANAQERLARVGCPVEVYLDMVQNPEFLRLLSRTGVELIVIPQIPLVQAALTVKAAHGDEKATRLLFEVTRLLEVQSQDEIRMQYARMDEEAMLRLMRTEAEKTIRFIEEYHGEDLTAAAPPEPKPEPGPAVVIAAPLDIESFKKPC